MAEPINGQLWNTMVHLQINTFVDTASHSAHRYHHCRALSRHFLAQVEPGTYILDVLEFSTVRLILGVALNCVGYAYVVAGQARQRQVVVIELLPGLADERPSTGIFFLPWCLPDEQIGGVWRPVRGYSWAGAWAGGASGHPQPLRALL